MKLIGNPTSPYVRKVRIVLAEKKIDYEFVIDSPISPDSIVPQFNPIGRVPVLVLDDDTAIFDSPVIVDYLDNVAPNSKLMPQPNRDRMEAKRWEALGDGLLDAALAARNEGLRPKRERSEAVIAKNRAVIERCVEFMARELSDKPWCMGTHFSLADICVGCALGYLDLRFADIDWRSAHASLDKLYEKLMQRPSFIDTAPPEAERQAA
jgi:glutathione S-transferase